MSVNAFVDEFSSEEFNDTSRKSFPWLMLVAKPKKHGIFVTTEQAEEASWKDYRVYPSYTHELKTGDELAGFLIPNPRLLVIQSGEMLKLERDTGKIVGTYEKGDNKRGYKAGQKHLVMFLGEDNKPLHEHPFAWTIKSGVMQAQFSINLREFRKQFEKAWSQSRGEKNGAKSNRFHALTVFEFFIGVEMMGEGSNSNNAAVIKGFVTPTPETVKSLFVGYDEDTKKMAFEIFDDNEDFGIYQAAEEKEEEQPDLLGQFYTRLEKAEKLGHMEAAANLDYWVDGLPDDVGVEAIAAMKAAVEGLKSKLLVGTVAPKTASTDVNYDDVPW
jgi:Family of unknown function (DUF5895)